MVYDEMSPVYLRLSQSYTLNYLHTEATQIIIIFFPWVCFGKKMDIGEKLTVKEA